MKPEEIALFEGEGEVTHMFIIADIQTMKQVFVLTETRNEHRNIIYSHNYRSMRGLIVIDVFRRQYKDKWGVEYFLVVHLMHIILYQIIYIPVHIYIGLY